MNGIRTDLALEAHEMCASEAREEEKIDGVLVDIKKDDGISLTRRAFHEGNGYTEGNQGLAAGKK